MAIDQISGDGTIPAKKELTGSNSLGKDDFLNLLVTQLQYQDPMKPMDSTDFTAQLAQFSSLEQLSNLNSKFDALNSSQTTLNNTQAVSFIGKTIMAEGNALSFNGSSPVDCFFSLKEATSATSVHIYDSSGLFIRTFDTGPLSAGSQAASWDGRDQNGNPMPGGPYFFEVAALNADDAVVTATTLTEGVVTGVAFSEGKAYLTTAGKEIPIDAVHSVKPTA